MTKPTEIRLNGIPVHLLAADESLKFDQLHQENDRLLRECFRLQHKIDELKEELEAVKKREAAMREALMEVLTHRSADRDSNHVMWIGEGTMLKCEAALKHKEIGL